jgi:hypothetical protein
MLGREIIMKDESNLVLERVLKFQESLIGVVHTAFLNEQYYADERNYLLENFPVHCPTFLKKCRTVDMFQNKLRQVARDNGSWA